MARSRVRPAPAITIAPGGECALLVRLERGPTRAAQARVLALLAALDAAPPTGLYELVPAYASLLIAFDPLATTPEAIERAVHAAQAAAAPTHGQRGRLVRIPVRYGGEDGPDLEDVARLVGLSAAEVVRRHAAARYRVGFLGFVAGFPYLTGLPAELSVPRLASPRVHVPAGSVALAGRQAGIYAVGSPGGWRVVGWTPLRIFDPAADPPALLRPGDRVRFVPVTDIRGDGEHSAAAGATTHAQPVATEEGVPWLRVLRPGALATVQDIGRPGHARHGVSPSGAADQEALWLGNALLGNPAGAGGLELTLGGGVFQALGPCAVALTGAVCEARVEGRALRPGAVATLATGEVLEVGPTRGGARAYLCVAGGVAVLPVLGSRATDVRAGLGGLEGRALRPGDVLARGAMAASPATLVGRRLPAECERRAPEGGVWTLRVLPGPHTADAPNDLTAVLRGVYSVDARSDRVGVRLRWQETGNGERPAGGETLSEGVPRGAVQLPPDGEPIVLLADHQSTGGYRIPAVVIAADRWQVGQLRPGAAVRFVLTSPAEATEALRARRAWLERVEEELVVVPAVGGAQPAEPDAALLMRGFAEWSEEAEDGE
jgi:KipI family sensor histidine kinase inhibitor